MPPIALMLSRYPVLQELSRRLIAEGGVAPPLFASTFIREKSHKVRSYTTVFRAVTLECALCADDRRAPLL